MIRDGSWQSAVGSRSSAGVPPVATARDVILNPLTSS